MARVIRVSFSYGIDKNFRGLSLIGPQANKYDRQFLSVALALEFLALTTDMQQRAIPDCPACDAWSEMMLPLNEVLSTCGSALPAHSFWRTSGGSLVDFDLFWQNRRHDFAPQSCCPFRDLETNISNS
ncbi:hypothetical protein [Pseudomonas sp. FEN]|uniref:hypothetical protein n=1 Tax=Pseudomonas sp. FEN TaxID=2767468 RepID=UPI00174CF4B0|nr:hypothetical protein [Pseudomonas sp. FEN]